MKSKNAPGNVNYRRQVALERLLALPEKNERVEKEIEVLKSRVVDPGLALITKRKKYRGPK